MVGARTLRTGATLLAGISALLLSACDQTRDHATPEAPAPGTTGAPGASAPPAGVENIKDAPQRYYGKTVTVTGDVDKIYNDRAFELEGTGWAFNDNITVLTKTPVRMGAAQLAKDTELIVTGTVRRFIETDVERDLGWDIGNEVTIHLKERPVLIADSIRMVNEYGRWTASGAPASAPVTTTLWIVTAVDQSALVGRKVDLGREHVQSVAGKGLWVGPNALSQVFVLPKQPPKDIKAGDRVRVADGTVQKAPADAAKAWDLPANMQGVAWADMLYVKDATVTKLAETGAEKDKAGGKR